MEKSVFDRAIGFPLPEDYLDRVYAGVLGKLIGVYIGRPFEGWTHKRIMKELGHIRYYVNEKLGVPLVVTDDDISGTFTFVRALEDYDRPDSKDVGDTWLNYTIKEKTIFWWGGNGVSTEHTAFLNLKNGIEAPRSGDVSTNGKTIAEQIGAQIFIDGWAMAAPGNPLLASRLAQAAGSVSHCGESVQAAMLWAAMEAEAFLSKDVGHLLETGLKVLSPDTLIANVIADVRAWCVADKHWMKTRQRIEDKYGYHKFPGFCHVVPNHAIMIMALIYGGHSFDEAMHIVNTCGWDTDCNSGNLACLLAIMYGLDAFEGGPDWRGPLSDRVFVSSADGGYSINNAARIAYDVANMGRKLVGQEPLEQPKFGAQFHFSLPGSVQGFQVVPRGKAESQVTLEQSINETNNRPSLAIRIRDLAQGTEDLGPIEVVTQTFAPPDVHEMSSYELVCTPLVYPGQTLKVVVGAADGNSGTTHVRLVLRAYTFTDKLETFTSHSASIKPGQYASLVWTIPAVLGCRPIECVGITISASDDDAENTPRQSQSRLDGTIWLDYLKWEGMPTLTLKAVDDTEGPRDFYKRSFVRGSDIFEIMNGKLVVAQDEGKGLVIYGTREWRDYRAVFRDFIVNVHGAGKPAGVAVRVRGLNSYYGLVFTVHHDSKNNGHEHGHSSNRVVLVKSIGENKSEELASEVYAWSTDTPYTITFNVEGNRMRAMVGNEDIVLEARDAEYTGGGIGMLATNGSVLVGSIEVGENKY
ncbi:ADP-ribosylation/Crystallin J1 [Hypoxylon sp. NC1633]|nr:ADP-ribosylation/Crystallin J1 [Hypoxylon sp. NC1633]